MEEKINKIRELISNKIVSSMYVEYLTKTLDLTTQEALDICIQLTKEGLLSTTYEIRCPNCSRILEESSTISKLGKLGECMYCEEGNIEIMENMSVKFNIK